MACTKYSIQADDSYFEAFVALEVGYQNRITRLLTHIASSPTDTNFPGLKQLRGEWSGYFQYFVSERHGTRLIYWIADDDCQVNIDYLGNHPSWSRTRDNQSL